jgi:ornithine decarboxylase
MMSKARFVLSKSKVSEKYDELTRLSDIISYSFKTNAEVGKILDNYTECFFSVHTIEDLKKLTNMKRIWFFAQAWDYNEINILFTKGIDKFVVDNENDLNALLDYISIKNRTIDLLLRIRLKEHSVQTGKHFVFGISSDRINEILPKLKQNKHIANLGIHFHRKTQNVSEWSLKEELQDTIKNWDSISLVNIGGGIPAEYKNFSATVLQDIFAKIIDLRKWLNSKKIKMIIEPGRYIAAYAIKLEASIKSIYDNNIILDCSVYNAAMDTFVAHIRLLVENELEEDTNQGEPYTIKGCTPDSMDIFRYRVFLKNPKVGEKIVFLNAGAYTYSTDFCNLSKLKTVVVD